MWIVIGGLMKLVAVILGWILWFLGSVLDWILEGTVKMNSSVMNDIITGGWTMVRDILNIVFVIALLIIAFATIMRIEAYQFKALFPKLLIAAFLVNFSKTITLTLVSFFDAIMYAIMGTQSGKIGSAAIAAMLNLQSLTEVSSLVPATDITSFALVINYAVLVAFLGLLAMGIGGLASLLIVRTVMLMILIVFSPIIFVFNILPITKKYATEWQDKFIQYLAVGPIVALCYLLALFFASKGTTGITSLLKSTATSGIDGNEAVLTSNANFGQLFCILMAVGIMLMGFHFAQEASKSFASAVMGGIKKGLLATGGFAAGMAFKKPLKGFSASLRKGEHGFVGRQVAKFSPALARALPYLSPGSYSRAYKQYRTQAEGEESSGVGRVANTMGRVFSLGKRKYTFAEQAEDAENARRAKAENLVSSAEQQKAAIQAVNTGDVRSFNVAVLAAAKDNNLNDLTSILFDHKEFAAELKSAGIDTTDPEFTWKALRIMQNKMNTTNPESGLRIQSKVSDIAFAAGNYAGAGETTIDEKGKIRNTTPEEKEAIINDKRGKIEPQTFMRGLHPNAVTSEYAGTPGNPAEEHKAILANFNRAEIAQIGRTGQETLQYHSAPVKLKEDTELVTGSYALEDMVVTRKGVSKPITKTKGERLKKGDIIPKGKRVEGSDWSLAFARSINSSATKRALETEITSLNKDIQDEQAKTAPDQKAIIKLKTRLKFKERKRATADERAVALVAFTIESDNITGRRDLATELKKSRTISTDYKYDDKIDERMKTAAEVVS